MSTPGSMAKGSRGAVGALGRGLSQVTGRRLRQAGEGLRGQTPAAGRWDMGEGLPGSQPSACPPAATTQGSSHLPAQNPHGTHSAHPGGSALPAPCPGCSLHTSQALCPPRNNLHGLRPARAGGLTHPQRGCCNPRPALCASPLLACPVGECPPEGHGQGHCAWSRRSPRALTSRSGVHREVQPPHGERTRHLPRPTRGLSWGTLDPGPQPQPPAPSSRVWACSPCRSVYFKFGILLKHLLDV